MALVIIIAITISVGAFIFSWSIGIINVGTSTLQIEVTQVILTIDSSNNAHLTIDIKNIGSKSLIGAYAYGYDDNGKKFTLALPPLAPGQSGGNSLTIPLGRNWVVLDASGGDHYGIFYGSGWFSSDSVVGLYSAYFNNDGFIQMNDDTKLFTEKNLTLYAWVKRVNPSDGGDVIFSDINWPWMEHSWELSSGWQIAFYTNDNRHPISVSSSLAGIGVANQWYNLAFTWDGSTAKFFRDGSLIESKPFSANPDEYTGLPHRVGRRTGGAGPMHGYIDQLLVYHPSISDAEINFMYRYPDRPVTMNLILWYTFDEGNGSPYSFTVGRTYSIIIVYYSMDGSVKELSVAVQAKRI